MIAQLSSALTWWKTTVSLFCIQLRQYSIKENLLPGNADIIREMPNDSFDLIITSYSLYFFPHLIPDIARILLLTVFLLPLLTVRILLVKPFDLLDPAWKNVGILEQGRNGYQQVIFCIFAGRMERTQLEKYFKRVEQVNYKNSMIFNDENINDCIFYIQKKKNLIYKEVMELMPDKIWMILSNVWKAQLLTIQNKHGTLILNKDDGSFPMLRTQNIMLVGTDEKTKKILLILRQTRLSLQRTGWQITGLLPTL